MNVMISVRRPSDIGSLRDVLRITCAMWTTFDMQPLSSE